jgi:hypothetical protein
MSETPCTSAITLGAPSVPAKGYGKTASATPKTARFSGSSAEIVATGSAKLRGKLLRSLLRKMEPRFYVDPPAYVLIAKSASQMAR